MHEYDIVHVSIMQGVNIQCKTSILNKIEYHNKKEKKNKQCVK